MSLSESKCWYSNNCLHSLNRAVPLANKSWYTVSTKCLLAKWFLPKRRSARRHQIYVSNKTDFKALNNFQGRTFLELSRSETNAVTTFTVVTYDCNLVTHKKALLGYDSAETLNKMALSWTKLLIIVSTVTFITFIQSVVCWMSWCLLNSLSCCDSNLQL